METDKLIEALLNIDNHIADNPMGKTKLPDIRAALAKEINTIREGSRKASLL